VQDNRPGIYPRYPRVKNGIVNPDGIVDYASGFIPELDGPGINPGPKSFTLYRVVE
jgi:hypothetical protein